jgi:hypothetical protein
MNCDSSNAEHAETEELVLGMAKGRAEFKTVRGRSGSGKRRDSELDLLRLIYASTILERRSLTVHAYFVVLRQAGSKGTLKSTLEGWLKKYEAEGRVKILERVLTDAEYRELEAEKTANAAAQERQGGEAIAELASQLAEEFLHAQIQSLHADVVPGPPDARPLGIDWDAWYIVRGQAPARSVNIS